MNKAELKQKIIDEIILEFIRVAEWELGDHMIDFIGAKLQLYADKQLDKFADFIADNYEPEDADTTTIHDWLFKFKSNQEGE